MEALLVNLGLEWAGDPVISLERPPIDRAQTLYPLECSPDEPVFVEFAAGDSGRLGDIANTEGSYPSGATLAAGKRLLESLCAHPAVSQALRIAHSDQNAISPILLRIAPGRVERLPWECLHDENKGFLALDERWPIARLVGVAGSRADCRYDPPLRLVAALTALNVEAGREWDGLHEALRTSGVDAQIRVFVCEDDLHDHIKELGDERVHVSFLSSRQMFLAEIESFRPHLVHFFCHGHAGRGMPYLELATRTSWATGQERAITFEPRELRCMAEAGVCLAVLNCCEGAKASRETGSLAFSLASKGFPAVVAMRCAISVKDANSFSRAFYRTLLGEIRAVDAAADEEVEVMWPRLLQESRSGLCDKYDLPLSEAAATHPEWSFPVLYMGSDTTHMKKVPIRGGSLPESRLGPDQIAYLRAQIDALSRARAALHPDTPGDISNQIQTEIASVTAQLYGNRSPGQNQARPP